VPDATQKVNNGRKDVPAILLGTVAVDKANMASTIVADGWQKKEAVYKDVPKDQWPSP
jgi:D-xylose transport system substrate-binding protein